MDKAKESFDTEIGSEANIKGVNSICICSDEEKALVHVLIIVVEVEIGNNWGKKSEKLVEKSKKEFVKAFIVVEAFNS